MYLQQEVTPSFLTQFKRKVALHLRVDFQSRKTSLLVVVQSISMDKQLCDIKKQVGLASQQLGKTHTQVLGLMSHLF